MRVIPAQYSLAGQGNSRSLFYCLNFVQRKRSAVKTHFTVADLGSMSGIDLEPGDEVITTPLSDMGTVAPIVQCNCVPIFADVGLGTQILEPESIRERITDRTEIHFGDQIALGSVG